MLNKNDPIYIESCADYNEEQLRSILLDAIKAFAFDEKIKGAEVVIKPNLVRKMQPQAGGTTHPVMLSALIKELHALGARSVLIAESPGGIYNAASLASIYAGCGIEQAAKEAGATLNFDTSFGTVPAPKGEKTKNFEIIDPIRKAKVIINLCKLKSHGMLMLSCGAKNFFGVVPGVLKFEMHARFPNNDDFSAMLADLNEVLHEDKAILSICDGIVGMEGNGPTSGDPINLGVVLASTNPFNLDLAAAKIIGMKQTPDLLARGIERGYCPEDSEQLHYIKSRAQDHQVKKFRLPDSGRSSTLTKVLTLNGGKYARFFEPRPVINKKDCKGCGECVRSCPQHTITMEIDKKGKKRALIHPEKCIKCYCCQELCPFKCVDIHKNPLILLVNKL